MYTLYARRKKVSSGEKWKQLIIQGYLLGFVGERQSLLLPQSLLQTIRHNLDSLCTLCVLCVFRVDSEAAI